MSDELGINSMPKKLTNNFLRKFFSTPIVNAESAGGGPGVEQLEEDGITYLRPSTGRLKPRSTVVVQTTQAVKREDDEDSFLTGDSSCPPLIRRAQHLPGYPSVDLMREAMPPDLGLSGVRSDILCVKMTAATRQLPGGKRERRPS